MKKNRKMIMSLLIVAFLSVSSFAQTSEADKAWKGFWSKFTSAVKKENKVALKKLMDSNFFGGVGSPSRSDWLALLDNSNLWKELQKSAAKGTVSYYSSGRGDAGGFYPYKKKRPARKTKDEQLYFEFYNKQWRFVSVMSGE